MRAAKISPGKSVGDDELTPLERGVLAVYRWPPASAMRRQMRLSIEYAVATGVFAGLGVWTGQPLYGVAVYVVFLCWMFARLRAASRFAGVMPRIIEKYEARIAALQAELERLAPPPDGGAPSELDHPADAARPE